MWGPYHVHVTVHGDAAVWLTALGTFLLAAAACFALKELSEAKRDRHIQVLSDFGRRWDDEALRPARDLRAKYNSNELADAMTLWVETKGREAPDVLILLRVANYFEDLAVIVELGKLDMQWVRKILGTSLIREWTYWREAILRLRANAPNAYTEFETLAVAVGYEKPKFDASATAPAGGEDEYPKDRAGKPSSRLTSFLIIVAGLAALWGFCSRYRAK